MSNSARTACVVSETKQHDAGNAVLPKAQLGMQTLTSALCLPSGAHPAGSSRQARQCLFMISQSVQAMKGSATSGQLHWWQLWQALGPRAVLLIPLQALGLLQIPCLPQALPCHQKAWVPQLLHPCP